MLNLNLVFLSSNNNNNTTTNMAPPPYSTIIPKMLDRNSNFVKSEDNFNTGWIY